MAEFDKPTFLSASDLRSETVTIKRWKLSGVLREWTGIERDEYVTAIERWRDPQTKAVPDRIVKAAVVAACLYDDQGRRIFSFDDAPALAKKSHAVVNGLFERAVKLNALGEDEIEARAGN